MRMALRGLALLCALAIVWTLLFVIRLGRGGVETMIRTGPMGISTCVAWAVTLLAGPFAVGQLLRLRTSGRVLGAIVFGTLAVHYLLSAAFLRDPGDPWPPMLLTGLLTGACAVLLWIPPARQATSHAS